MNRDDIIRMAHAASGGKAPDGWGVELDYDQLERFATLVAEHEREECALIAERHSHAATFLIRERGAP